MIDVNDLHFQTLEGKSFKAATLNKKLLAVIFLSPECPLSQNYTLTLNKLYSRYKKEVDIVGVFPGRSYTSTDYSLFRKKYNIQFLLLTDTGKETVKHLGATITPEVFLMDKKRSVLYQGAIDNWAISLGKQRNRVTENYLDDAINDHLNHKWSKVKQTKAVGCLINDL
ncbi:MAG: redoxin domain-containing protein [Agriterribacter sp.]